MNTYLICGLGNPGDKYAETRHNIGFKALEEIYSGGDFDDPKEEKKFSSLISSSQSGDKKIILALPLTYMNKSGEAIQKIKSYFKIPKQNIIIIYDDIDLPPGEIRIRKKGGPGTHNGMKSIIQSLGTEDFARIRIGIGEPYPPQKDLSTYVLEPFTKKEKETLDPKIKNIPTIVKDFLETGIEAAMNKWN